MALEYYTPGVYVEEVSGGDKPVTAAPTSIVGFIGETRTGPVNKPIQVTSWTQYFNAFIGYRTVPKVNARGALEKDADGNPMTTEVAGEKKTYLDWAVYTHFANGGAKCHVVGVGSDYKTFIADMEAQFADAAAAAEAADEDKKEAADAIAESYKAELEALQEQSAAAADFDLNNAIIGNDGGPNKRSGLSCFKDVSEVAILCAPGITASPVQQEMLSYVENANIFCVLDAPETLEDLEAYGLSTDFVGLSQLPGKCASKQAALYFPWVKVYDPVTKSDITVPPSGFVTGVYGRVDDSRGVHKAPANEPIRLATGLAYTLNDAEQESLNMKGVNVIRSFADAGLLIWGARTTITAADPEWKYINVRRLFNMVEKSIQDGTNWAVFEPNDPALWNKLQRNVSAFLLRIYNSGAMAGTTPDQGFFVNCNATTNPQENIDAGIVTVEIGIAPVKPAEFVVFKIAQVKPGATSLAG